MNNKKFLNSKNPHSKLWGIPGDFYSRKWVAASCWVLDPFSLNKKPNHRRAVGFFKFVLGYLLTAVELRGFRPKTNNKRAGLFPETGLGIDIESIDRFKKLNKVNDRTLLQRIYTARELSYCFAKRYPAQHLAARFAGKEAVLKALGELGAAKQHLNTIEIGNRKSGAPQVTLLDKGGPFCVKISLSHDQDKALACALAWRIT